MVTQKRVVLYGYIWGQGGIQTHLQYLSNGLVAAGFEVFLITPSLHSEKVAVSEEFHRPSITILELPFSRNPLEKIIRFVQILRKVRRISPQVFYMVGTGYIPSLMPLFFPPGIHSVFHEVMSGELDGLLDSRSLVSFLFDSMLGQSLIVTKNFVKKFHWKKKSGSIATIPQPLEEMAKLPVVHARAVKKGAVKAAYFGRVIPHKGIYWLVSCWDRIGGLIDSLDIYGAGHFTYFHLFRFCSIGIGLGKAHRI